MTAREFAKAWRERGLPETVFDQLTGQVSRVTFVDVDVVPDDEAELLALLEPVANDNGKERAA